MVEQMRANAKRRPANTWPETLGWVQGGRATATGWRTTTKELIPLRRRTHAAATAQAYRGGNGSLSAVLDARRVEIDTASTGRLEMDAAGLWAQLEYPTSLPRTKRFRQIVRPPVTEK